MAGFRHTSVGSGVARSDYAALGQVEDGTINWAVAGGTADALTATLSPAVTVLADGQLVFLRASSANATTTPTLALNGLAIRTMTRAGGAALAPGDIPGPLAEIILRYNLTNTRWELLNPATLVPATNSITSAMLQAASVLYAKIQNVTNGRLLGNFSGAAAAPSEYALGSGLAVSGATLNNTALPPQGLFKNLSIKVATNTTVAVAAEAVAMSDGAGNYRTAAISATCDLGSNGAVNKLDAGTIAIDTWYYVWAISNGTTDGTLASTSSTAPTLPNGYTFKARIGAVRTIHASATLYGTWQLGRRAQYVVGLAQTTGLPEVAKGPLGTYSTTAPTWSAATVQGNSGQAAIVPLTAGVAFLVGICGGYKGGTGGGGMQVAPSTSYGGYQNANAATAPFDNAGAGSSIVGAFSFSVILEATTVQVVLTNIGCGLVCEGWEDNL
jgi:hypothetical protein